MSIDNLRQPLTLNAVNVGLAIARDKGPPAESAEHQLEISGGDSSGIPPTSE